jgi:high-affinity iron transporter
VAAGFAGACVVAALTAQIAALFEGIGQELFNAAVLGTAVLMLAWHNIWMSVHGAELSQGAKKVGIDVSEGRRELSAILLVIAIAVLREGSESALFIYGMMSGGEVTPLSALAGAAIGLGGGASLGLLLYAGMLKIPMRWFFAVTSTLILLLAAGMASRMAQFLVQADVLPSLKSPLWDLSGVLPTESLVGTFLHALMGYDAAPAGMQVVFYLTVLVTIWIAMRRVQLASPAATGKQTVGDSAANAA